VAFPACSISGTVGPPPDSAGRRPSITRSLALSAYSIVNGNRAISMPVIHSSINPLILMDFKKLESVVRIIKEPFFWLLHNLFKECFNPAMYKQGS
jgi:hypothetical protein